MTRRGRSRSGISLFSFQDIMASVIGMLFFIVMMLALDIVESTSAALTSSPPPGTDDEAALKARADEHKRVLNQLEEEGRRQNQMITAMPSGREAVEDARKLHGRLTALYALIEQANKELDAIGQSLDEGQKGCYEKVRTVWRLTREVEALKERIRLTVDSPRVSYILDEQVGQEPWLVEVTARGLRVASRDGNWVQEFQADSQGKRRAQLLAWAKEQSPHTHYFLLVVKPSGVAEGYRLAKEFHDLGFDIGTDYLPEDWKPF